jgi:ATP-dependent helicase/nuclease subunit A
MNVPTIPDEVLQRQREASDPTTSAWVSANAGSGKTYVLAQRVIRLLLAETEPSKILCLTFTKAAAANMATTVFDTLAKWTALDEAALDAAIRAMSNAQPSPKLRRRARQLFALALETPGGLKVQTIHAFCTRLLQQFPFEANVSARFAVLEDSAQRQLLEQTIFAVLLEAAAALDSPLGRALTTAITAASDQSFRAVVNEAIGERDALMSWIERAGGVEAAIAELSETLGVAPGETTESVEAEFFTGSLIAATEWPAVAAALAEGSKADAEHAARFHQVGQRAGADRLKTYLSIFCTAELAPRKNIVTKAIRERHPALFQRLLAEQERVCGLLGRRRAVVTRDRTGALLTIAATVIARYQAEKERRGVLDYDDLIDKARDLLGRVDAAWVHYKLDLGIDHVLIDEAQDTSPKQWEVVERLVAEFAAGAGARGSLTRSIFAVGDDKQSIFSFQGAEPEAFAGKRSAFKRAYDAGGLAFRPLEFKYSFRSVQAVLDAVDTVFKHPAAFRGLTADHAPTAHTAVRAQAPGLVEIWPTVDPDERSQIEGWDAPFDTTSETSPRVKLARRIAKCVGLWIARGDRVGDGDKRHAMRPGDVLVLVRQRGPLFEAIIRALKNAGVPVAGADRLVLTEHIAVMDLIALADALLLPQDDLALASVLKSPLFGLDEDQLFALAWNRPGGLRAALHAKAGDDPVFAEAAARLERLAVAATQETPFAFYARVLGPERGRQRFLARLGHEATDALDEFLNLALDYESRETPSLQGFIAWLRAANAQVKRDMEIARDEVRVMTVHGAKGLEAPVVILADTTTPPAGAPQHQPRLLTLPATGAAADAPGHCAWAVRKDDDVGPMTDARAAVVDAAENEYRRLLYVAMTRAADRLVICGATGTREKPQGCWYDLVAQALTEHCSEEPADDGDGTVFRFRKFVPAEEPLAPRAAAAERARQSLPVWLKQNAAVETCAAPPLSPSSAYDETVLVRSVGSGAERKQALARGAAIHRLLQSLPDLPRDTRAEAARRHLARIQAINPADHALMVDQVLAVLDDSRFADLFIPGSRAEVPIVGRLPRPGRPPLTVSGQVDRLVVTADAVLIADYKTNRPAPRTPPEPYVTQLALYRAVLAQLYPGKAVRAALIWTDVPDLIEISSTALDAALAAVRAP